MGYTSQQRRDVSDASAGVTGDQVREAQVATVEEALRGRLAGVQISASGEPGRPAQVIIRGQNFLTNPGPLYVVDGMYLTENPNLNADDIESIEVLKDASAAAQYGAQAANGVVVIRTRRGRGDTRVEVRSYYGYQQVPRRVPMMNTTDWAAIARQAYQNAGLSVIPGAATPPPISTDWQDAVFRTGAIQDHGVTVPGGTGSASYLISGGYTQQDGAIVQTGFHRYNFRINSQLQRGRLARRQRDPASLLGGHSCTLDRRYRTASPQTACLGYTGRRETRYTLARWRGGSAARNQQATGDGRRRPRNKGGPRLEGA